MKHLLWSIIIIVQVGLLAGCMAQPVMPTPTASEPISTTEEGCRVSVGIITSLSGEYQERATELVRGYDLARDDINAAGGVLGCALELHYRDDASTSVEAENSLEALVTIDQALVVVGSFSSVITLNLVPLSAQYQVPLLAHNPTNSLITDLGYAWVFRTMPSSWTTLDQLIAYISAAPLNTAPTVAVLYEDSGYGQDIYVSLLSRLKTYGISLVTALPVAVEDTDFMPQIERVAASGANVLVLVGNSIEQALTLRAQIAAAGLQFDVFMAPGGAYTSTEFLETPSANGIVTAFPWLSTLPLTDALSGQTTPEFIAHFTERYGQPPTHRSVNAYTNIYLAREAISAALTIPPSTPVGVQLGRIAVRDALRELNVEETLFGPIDFDDVGQNATDVILVQMIDGEIVIVSPPELATGELVLPAPMRGESN